MAKKIKQNWRDYVMSHGIQLYKRKSSVWDYIMTRSPKDGEWASGRRINVVLRGLHRDYRRQISDLRDEVHELKIANNRLQNRRSQF